MPSNSESRKIRLNKRLSELGYCSRRKADELISSGKVSVNGHIIKELGHKVLPNDSITVFNKPLDNKTDKIYILLHKPKNIITSVSDTHGRKTVIDLVPSDIRVYPVGRLDRNSTGLLLLTNDGKLTHKLTHPSSKITKEYKVSLDKPISKFDYQKLLSGIKLEDGISKFDSIRSFNKDYLIELHSGKNRIIRRTFEFLHYRVKNLHRTKIAFLELGNLECGFWRYLSSQEVEKLYSYFT